MNVADTLSRAYSTGAKRDLGTDVNEFDDSEERMFNDNILLPEQKVMELQHTTNNNAVLQELEKATKTVWPAVSTGNDVLKPYLFIVQRGTVS